MIKQNGITLVGLSATIIVLIILSAATISTVIGNNGVFEVADKTVEEDKEGKAQEEVHVAWIALEGEYWSTVAGTSTVAFFTKDNLEKQLTTGKIESFTYNPGGISTGVYYSEIYDKKYDFSINTAGYKAEEITQQSDTDSE